MEKKISKEIVVKAKVTTDSIIKDYINDPYFVKKREIASAFLAKVGLPVNSVKENRKISFFLRVIRFFT